MALCRCIASAILKFDTLIFDFVACLYSIIAFEIDVFNNNSKANFIYHLRVLLCGVEYTIIWSYKSKAHFPLW